jgi:hypoxanthine phosphoribosyltransferase
VNETNPQHWLDDSEELFSAAEINAAVEKIAREITHALADSKPLVLCVMNGATVFAGKLLPLLDFPLEFDSVRATRYRNTTTGGEILWKTFPETDMRDRTVLLLDDILDQGHTLAAISQKCREAGASRILIAVLTEKETGHPKPARADFIGLPAPNRYIFGCGMDIHGWWRNLAEIRVMKDKLTPGE